VIGAGKIGCGFLAPLFHDAGWDVVVAARSETVVDHMRAAGEYTVRTTGAGGVRCVRVTPVLTGSPAFDDAVAGADVVATAVGSASVAALGAPLARALAARPAHRPIDVWTVENGDVAPQLHAALRQGAARHGLRLPPVGVAGAIAYAAVTQGDWRRSPRPEFVGDTAKWLLVHAAPLVAGMPRLPRVGATPSYAEHLEAKRFVFSAGHAMCAFIGARHGHHWLHDAAADRRIRPLVADALVASRRALGGGRDLRGPVGWVLDRYANAELLDTVTRVARDPIRKLAPDGPLVGPARLVARSAGVAPIGFATAIASALNYRNGADPQACLLAEMLVGSGLATVLSDVCDLDPAEPLARQVMRIYQGWEPAIARGTLSDPLASRAAA
jgi:mannitol-1-phosphate 5-dehydrogenase